MLSLLARASVASADTRADLDWIPRLSLNCFAPRAASAALSAVCLKAREADDASPTISNLNVWEPATCPLS
jgi:hypothetical protein